MRFCHTVPSSLPGLSVQTGTGGCQAKQKSAPWPGTPSLCILKGQLLFCALGNGSPLAESSDPEAPGVGTKHCLQRSRGRVKANKMRLFSLAVHRKLCSQIKIRVSLTTTWKVPQFFPDNRW